MNMTSNCQLFEPNANLVMTSAFQVTSGFRLGTFPDQSRSTVRKSLANILKRFSGDHLQNKD